MHGRCYTHKHKLVVGDNRNTLHVLLIGANGDVAELGRRQVWCDVPLEDPRVAIDCLALSPNGRWLVAASKTFRVAVVDLWKDVQPLDSLCSVPLPPPPAADRPPVEAVQLHFSVSNRLMVLLRAKSSERLCTTHLYFVDCQTCRVADVQRHRGSLVFHPSGQMVVQVAYDAQNLSLQVIPSHDPRFQVLWWDLQALRQGLQAFRQGRPVQSTYCENVFMVFHPHRNEVFVVLEDSSAFCIPLPESEAALTAMIAGGQQTICKWFILVPTAELRCTGLEVVQVANEVLYVIHVRTGDQGHIYAHRAEDGQPVLGYGMIMPYCYSKGVLFTTVDVDGSLVASSLSTTPALRVCRLPIHDSRCLLLALPFTVADIQLLDRMVHVMSKERRLQLFYIVYFYHCHVTWDDLRHVIRAWFSMI